MDSSNTSGMNSTHLQQSYHNNPSYSSFINEIEAFAADDSVSGNDEFSNFSWDPALFAGDAGSNFPQQQQQQQQSQQPSMQANLNQTLTRQSNSPALQQQHPAHQQYPPHNYGHAMYEHRNMAQPSFDDRFMSRPSASPGPFEHHTAYQQQMPFNSYGFQQQQQYPRQNSPQNPFYAQPQRPVQPQPQQAPPPLRPINARQSSQTPQMDNMHMHQYPGGQRVTHTFVNPSMVMNGGQQTPQQQQGVGIGAGQQYAGSPYFQKPGSTVDPQALHAMQLQNYPQMQTMPHMLQQQQQQPTQSHQIQSQPQMSSMQLPYPEAQAAKAVATTKTPKESTAPKKPRMKTTKVKKDGTTDSDSSDGLEIEDEPPESKPALLVVSAPTDEKGRALYNAVEAVWYPRNKSPQAEDVRKGIAAFGETVRSLRDSWKAKNDSLRKAELPNSDTAADASRLKEDVAHYRQTMETVITRSLQYGHDAIVKRLGENHFTLSALYSFLFDRANVLDYDSTLVSSIFKLAVKFDTLDEEMLEQVKWSKVLQRWIKRATNESKGFAQQIVANAQAQSARKRVAKAEETPGSPASVNGTKTGVKRPREGDTIGVPASKKVVKQASKPLALQSAERRKALEKDNQSKGVAPKLDKGSASVSSTVASRPKVMTAPPKTKSFAGLLSASKRPGTSNAEKAAAAAANVKDKPLVSSTPVPPNGLVATVKKEETKKDSPPRNLGPGTAKSTTSFLSVLTDMNKPKESETKKVDVDPNESEEQRAKRMRKEARRKLRVRWKPDEELVQTKLFTHDPDEETGQTDSMMRDAGDTMKEGEMLKRHMALKDDEDEEEDETSLEDFGEYTALTEVDFSPINDERAGNFIKFAGTAKPESQAGDAQNKYEEDTLMTTYTFKSDRPDTPKELPSVNDDDDFQPVVDFGEPTGIVRGREREILARKNVQAPSVASGGMDLAAQLRALGMQTGQQLQPQAAGYSAFPQQSIPQTAAPQIAPSYDLSRLLGIVQQAKQMNQAPVQPPVYQAPVPVVPPNIPENVAAILRQVSGQNNQGLPLGNAGNPNPFPGNEDYSRKHGRDDSNEQSGNKKKKNKGGEGKPYNYKTITCSFWQEGKCTKGDACTYKHEL